jgi:hypothetical protein
MQVYNWDEIQDYNNHNQPPEPTFNEKIIQEMIAECKEERWRNHQKEKMYRKKEKEDRFKREIERELAQTSDPWTTLQILLKIPEWRIWYKGQTSQQQARTLLSIGEIMLMQESLRQIDIVQRQWDQYNDAMFWQGRFQGRW